jgi:hypothetical protein
MDATGFRIGGKTQWLDVTSAALLAFYRFRAKRGSQPANAAGIAVHDRWKPNSTMQAVLRAQYNAHRLGEPKALAEIEMEDWAGKLRRFCAAPVRRRTSRGQRAVPLRLGLRKLFLLLVLFLRLAAHKDTLRFLRDAAVPVVNIEQLPVDAGSCSSFLERAKGFEPSTPTLARLCSTPELHPHPRRAKQASLTYNAATIA